MDFIPHIVGAEYVKEYKVKIKFDDGSVKVVDLEPYSRRSGIFSEFKNMDFFRKFYIDLNTLCWPNGADIAPERLYEIGTNVLDESFAKT